MLGGEEDIRILNQLFILPTDRMTRDDCSLVKEVQQGKYASFEVLYHKYFQRIYAFIIVKSGGNVPLSQDVTSETFLKAFEHIENFVCEKTGGFSAWLYRIAYTSFIDMIKEKNTEIPLREGEEGVQQIDFVDLYQKKNQTQEIIAYLEQLGTEKKDIFLLRVWENMTYEEIAEIVGKSVESCRQDFSRTLKKLAERFGKIF